ncbi:conserved hypothetical protein [Paecilomyces variotii No. 5]|uniref:Uncharacterized protein n=1 Tax=Byssochlamys spectabilis (strain No. 5 / NBRC 109023) TaxID=1356009 RepID=V5FZG3_BYSSN|nr:conserved hypothetical protein [Paecilomyces variotii No. 5]
MIIWDTGEYSVLPYYPQIREPETEDSLSDVSELSSKPDEQLSDSEKLREAFQNRKIRLRLNGTRLPPNYTITMRLTTQDNVIPGAAKRPHKRRRRTAPSLPREPSSTPSRSPSPDCHRPRISSAAPVHASESLPVDRLNDDQGADDDAGSASASDEEDIDERTRLTNAYPGAVNSVGSIHQRRWFITLDRLNSGFEPASTTRSGSGKKSWIRKGNDGVNQELLGFEPFYIRGPEVERSVVTGRLGKEVLEDEGVEGFTPRRGWKPVLE